MIRVLSASPCSPQKSGWAAFVMLSWLKVRRSFNKLILCLKHRVCWTENSQLFINYWLWIGGYCGSHQDGWVVKLLLRFNGGKSSWVQTPHLVRSSGLWLTLHPYITLKHPQKMMLSTTYVSGNDVQSILSTTRRSSRTVITFFFSSGQVPLKSWEKKVLHTALAHPHQMYWYYEVAGCAEKKRISTTNPRVLSLKNLLVFNKRCHPKS